MSENNITSLTPILENNKEENNKEENNKEDENCCESFLKCCSSLLDSGCCFCCAIFLIFNNK